MSDLRICVRRVHVLHDLVALLHGGMCTGASRYGIVDVKFAVLMLDEGVYT